MIAPLILYFNLLFHHFDFAILSRAIVEYFFPFQSFVCQTLLVLLTIAASVGNSVRQTSSLPEDFGFAFHTFGQLEKASTAAGHSRSLTQASEKLGRQFIFTSQCLFSDTLLIVLPSALSVLELLSRLLFAPRHQLVDAASSP